MKGKLLAKVADKGSKQFMDLLQQIVDKVNVMDKNMQLLNDNMCEIDEKLIKILEDTSSNTNLDR